MKKQMKGVHLSGADGDNLLVEVRQMLEQDGYRIAEQPDRAEVLLFLATARGQLDLESWLEATRACKGERWVCAPRLVRAKRRLLQHTGDVRFLIPGATGPKLYVDRILGQLYLREAPAPTAGFLVGRSPAIRQMLTTLDQYAPIEDPVLILGESGSGKELCARYLQVKRARGRQSSINCGNLQPDLVDSVLFGHVKGAFTGADREHPGILREAKDGICFLDEIGKLPYASQASLLRVLDNHKVRPKGGTREIALNCRMVLATNSDLEQACEDGQFLPDLYQRIAYLDVRVPPLRERMADLPLLVNHFIGIFNEKYKRHVLPPQSFDCFFGYHWPGNMRELMGCLTKTMLAAGTGPLNVQPVSDYIFNRSQRQRKRNDSIPFYHDGDGWMDLYHRARKAFLDNALQRYGEVNEKMVAWVGSKK